MQCLAMRRFQSLAILAFATIALICSFLYSFDLHPRAGLLAPTLSNRPQTSLQCTGLSDSSNSSQIRNLWPYLKRLFDTHKPTLETHQKDFPEGQTDSPSLESLNKHLHIGRVGAEDERSIHKHLVSSIPDMPLGIFDGRGVVMLSGGEQLQYAATSLGMLQLLGSQLPVELWMLNHTSAKEDWCVELATQGVICRFISDYVQNATEILEFSHQHTAAALLFSSFAEILYLDSDTMPVINPDSIFDLGVFTSTGAVLWPDFWKPTESPWTHYITGFSDQVQQQVSRYHTIDSTLMVWDKKKHWKVNTSYNHCRIQTHKLIIIPFRPSFWLYTTTIMALTSTTTLSLKEVRNGVAKILSLQLFVPSLHPLQPPTTPSLTTLHRSVLTTEKANPGPQEYVFYKPTLIIQMPSKQCSSIQVFSASEFATSCATTHASRMHPTAAPIIGKGSLDSISGIQASSWTQRMCPTLYLRVRRGFSRRTS